MCEHSVVIRFDEIIPSDTKVGVDNAQSYHKNVSNGKHDVFYNSPAIEDNQIEIKIPSNTSALIVITVYANDTKYTTMFYNTYMVFKAQNRYLAVRNCVKCDNSLCQDCNEKNWRTNTIAMMLRTRLLQYAYENDLINDAIKFYTDLIRVLDFKGITFEGVPSFYNNLDEYATTLL